MAIDERLDRLTGVVETLAVSVASRNARITGLLNRPYESFTSIAAHPVPSSSC